MKRIIYKIIGCIVSFIICYLLLDMQEVSDRWFCLWLEAVIGTFAFAVFFLAWAMNDVGKYLSSHK